VRCFDETLLGLHRACKCPFDVPEEFRLNERWNERRAIDRNKRAIFADTQEMDTTRDEFLSRAALAEDEHRILVLADLFDDFVDALHFFGDANEAAEAWARAKLFAEETVFLLKIHGTGDTFQAGAQLFDAERFRDVVERTHARSLHRGIDGSVLRKDHNRYVRMQVAYSLQEFETAALSKF